MSSPELPALGLSRAGELETDQPPAVDPVMSPMPQTDVHRVSRFDSASCRAGLHSWPLLGCPAQGLAKGWVICSPKAWGRSLVSVEGLLVSSLRSDPSEALAQLLIPA